MRTTPSTPSAASKDVLADAREFIPDRLYFTWRTAMPHNADKVHFFTVDNELVYVPFNQDFGPNSMAQVWKFCEIVKAKMRGHPRERLCLVSSTSYDRKTNAAFLMACYMMFCQGKTPSEAWEPMTDFDHGITPYRDAGYGQPTYFLTIPDILSGLYKAQSHGLLHLKTFDHAEYEWFEKVDNGDFNWICDKFIAIASPHDERTDLQVAGHIRLQRTPQGSIMDLLATRDATVNASLDTLVTSAGGSQSEVSTDSVFGSGRRRRDGRQLYSCYSVDDLVAYFKEYGVSAMVRLNNRLYDRTRFIKAGIAHHELYFPDGTTPPESVLRRFLEICESTPGTIAVHCKAGLGRTGSLIACYLMKHYLFTAAEVIGFLRVLRPGSIVGPQQNWLVGMQARMWKLHPASPLPAHISMLREPSFVATAKRVEGSVQAMMRLANELMDAADMEVDEEVDVSKLAIPKQPRKPQAHAGSKVCSTVQVLQAQMLTYMHEQSSGPMRRTKSQQMNEALDGLQLSVNSHYKVVKNNKVRPAPKVDRIDTAAVVKPAAGATTPSSSGTLVMSTPPSGAPTTRSAFRNLLSVFTGVGSGESR
ncbi:dual specificity protein phosphatase [Hyaloraphidium curvatum]|nr:dual specificity protein phosphatase [Hyaloraphidium curvatum]